MRHYLLKRTFNEGFCRYPEEKEMLVLFNNFYGLNKIGSLNEKAFYKLSR